MELKLYYRDLNESGKEKVLQFYGIVDERELNLDIFPLTIIFDF